MAGTNQEEIDKAEMLKLRDAVIKAVDDRKEAEEIAREFGMTVRDATEFSIKRHYDCGRGSVQDYARIYRLTVEEVLEILKQPEMSVVETIGDLIDQDYAGKTPVNESGEKYKIPYDLS